MSFKEEIFVFPADSDTNESIVKHPTMVQVEPDTNADCFVGNRLIVLPVYPVSNVVFQSFKRSKGLTFYAFKRKGSRSKRQYFYSQNINKHTLSGVAEKVAQMLEKVKS